MFVKVEIEAEGAAVELRPAGSLTIWLRPLNGLDGDGETCIDTAELRKALDVIDAHREEES